MTIDKNFLKEYFNHFFRTSKMLRSMVKLHLLKFIEYNWVKVIFALVSGNNEKNIDKESLFEKIEIAYDKGIETLDYENLNRYNQLKETWGERKL